MLYFLIGFTVIATSWVINSAILLYTYQPKQGPIHSYAWAFTTLSDVTRSKDFAQTSIWDLLILTIFSTILWPLFVFFTIKESYAIYRHYYPIKPKPATILKANKVSLLQRIAAYYHYKHHPEHYI